MTVVTVSRLPCPHYVGRSRFDRVETCTGMAHRDAEEVSLFVEGNGTEPSGASRRGGTVLRRSGPWSAGVLSLLRHYEAVGLVGVPRVIGTGFSLDGRETLNYLPGTSAHPQAWADAALPAIGDLLRRIHQAGQGFSPADPPRWRPWFGRQLTGSRPVLGHCDTGPWNIVCEEDEFSLIDWEFAGPVDAIWELAQACWLNAQLHDDDVAEANDLPSAKARTAQVGLLLDGYQLPRAERVGFADKLIEFAVRAARAEAVEHQVTAGTTAAVNDDGYPVLWAITWRARSAAWMADHRSMLEQAIA